MGCINIDVIGEKGDHTVILKTNGGQINVLSLLMDEFHEYQHSWSAASDHTSFYMGEIPAIYFADDKYTTKDSFDNPLEEIDIDKLKELTETICKFLIDFDIADYDAVLQNGFVEEYTDLPQTDEVLGYSLIQVNKVLKENGAGSKSQYILADGSKNKITITEEDSRFIDENLLSNYENYDTENDHFKFNVIDSKRTCIRYWGAHNFGNFEGNIAVAKALEVIEKIDDITNYGTLLYGLYR